LPERAQLDDRSFFAQLVNSIPVFLSDDVDYILVAKIKILFQKKLILFGKGFQYKTLLCSLLALLIFDNGLSPFFI
jgi:hypothetical protein